jgi:hypothetical protein
MTEAIRAKRHSVSEKVLTGAMMEDRYGLPHEHLGVFEPESITIRAIHIEGVDEERQCS